MARPDRPVSGTQVTSDPGDARCSTTSARASFAAEAVHAVYASEAAAPPKSYGRCRLRAERQMVEIGERLSRSNEAGRPRHRATTEAPLEVRSLNP